MKISSFPLPAKPILSAGAAAVVPSAFVSAAEVSAAVVAEEPFPPQAVKQVHKIK